jgi:hypothetical protein
MEFAFGMEPDRFAVMPAPDGWFIGRRVAKPASAALVTGMMDLNDL